MSDIAFKRRELLMMSGVAGLGIVAGRTALGAEQCSPTAAQTEGPFYPVRRQSDRDWDLTQISGREGVALGEVVYIQGRVVDLNCVAVPGVLVEIWQACHSGKYNHPSDPNTAELDPNFQYWGRVVTGADGSYQFKTIIPGAYPASSTWMRPPHIHFKLTAPGHRSFTTQMYFAGNPLNESDLILQALNEEQRKQVTIELNHLTNPHLGPTAVFDISLNLAGLKNLTPELD